MRLSQLLGSTLRESARDADLASHDLLLRAGYLRPLATGIFSLLHLGLRSLENIEKIVKEEMDAVGGVEISMPVVHPAELWQQTGRYDSIDESLLRFQDRAGRAMVLAMTHEEVVAALAASEISSYKQLPKLVYQIQTKFRDELRSRGGLIRVREFRMKDAYSLDSSWDGLYKQYQAQYEAYFRIMARVGLPVVAVLSDAGMMGGQVAHEFMYLSPIGEDTVFLDTSTGEYTNREVAVMAKPAPDPAAMLPLQVVDTPGTKSIEDLCRFLGISPGQTAKVVFYETPSDKGPHLVMALVRGDHEVNEVKLSKVLGGAALRPAEEGTIRAAGCVPGYASPVGIAPGKATVVADDLLPRLSNLVAGANAENQHLLNVNHGRDFQPDFVADIVNAQDGAPSLNGGVLKAFRGVEVGNIFQLGTKYSEALNAFFMGEDGRPAPIIMGSYGIGMGRLLACLAEEYHDDKGLCLPPAAAPFLVQLVSLADGEATVAAAEALYARLKSAGITVLYDDRSKKMASPGVKFNDADLRGMPIRITLSSKTLAEEQVEWKLRRETDARRVPLEAVLDEIHAAMAR